MNDQRLQISGRSELDSCMIASYIPPRNPEEYGARVMAAVSAHPFMLRATGSTALDLAYVAAGRYDGACYVSYKHWDVAAGKLLVREAGGHISENTGEQKLLFVSNSHIHSKLLPALQAV
jgi:myo-inositol-1(or 4)-monophosphatase